MRRRALCTRQRVLLCVPLVLAHWGVLLLTAGSVHLAADEGLTLGALADFLLGTDGGGTVFGRVGPHWWVLAVSLGSSAALSYLALLAAPAALPEPEPEPPRQAWVTL